VFKDEELSLVAGGSGFIGTNLCEYLLNKGKKVICLDNQFTGSINNIKKFESNSNFDVIYHDIIEPIYIRASEIYNLACPASPIHYQYDPKRTLMTSIVGTNNLLDLALETGAKFFQASTSEIYGDPDVHPQPEDYWGNVNPFGPRSCYDEGKRCGETLCYIYKKKYPHLEISIGRIFNTYGPCMSANDGRVISNFINEAINNEDITIYGDGLQTRSFCYVDDLVEVIYRLIQSGAAVDLPVNIGNPDEHTILDIANKIIELTDSRSKIIHLDLPQDDPKRRRPDIQRAKDLLDWEPRVSLELGLTQTIKYFEDLKNGSSERDAA